MQSTASTWFCTLCGAANDVGQSVCFSCNRARPGLAQDSTPADDAASLLQGRYRLLSQVGVGGFGEVYKALDTQRGERVVAIKQINLRGLSPQKTIEATDTFNRELHILSPLKHANLPRIYDHFTDPGHWYLVMEFLDGETLERYLENRQRQRSYAGTGTPGLLPLEEIFALAFQLCDVLDYLHAQQPPIIFRDLKPANIMRSGVGHICLIDFGIARHFRPGRTKDTTPLGSPGYAAPEQYGKAQTTTRSDLYSLGALLHYLVTGNDPSETPFQFAPLPPLSPTSLAGTRELETLILRMVDVDSSQRPASAHEVKEELQRIAYIVAGGAERRIWTPPPGQPPDPEVEGALQQQVQVQIQKHRTTTRRKFIRRGLLAGTGVIAGAGLIGALLQSGLGENIINTGPEPFDHSPGDFRGQASISSIALSPDGNLLVTVAQDHSARYGNDTIPTNLRVYRVDQDSIRIVNSIRMVKPGSSGLVPGQVSALGWSPDNRRLAIGFEDGSINIWDTSSGASSYIFNRSGSIESIAWSPDGTLIAVGGGAQGVRVSELDGTVISTYAGNSFFQRNFLSWSPDGTRIVTPYVFTNAQSFPGTLQVWDVKNSKTLLAFGELDMLQVAWSPDGNTIASLSVNGVLALYNASNATLIKSYSIQGVSNSESVQPVQLLWSPGSQYLALNNVEPDLQVWNVKNDRTRNLPSNLNSPQTVRWLPNGRQLFLIDATGVSALFDVSDL